MLYEGSSLMLMVSPTGSRLGKTDHPGLPISIPEIITSTVACSAVGADALHLHVRDSQGGHTLDAGIYREALAEVQATLPGFPIQVSTDAAGIFGTQAQRKLIEDLAPDWISLSLREMARNEDDANAIYALCKERGTTMQHIVYDTQDAALLRRRQAERLIPADPSVLLVLGRYGDQSRSARPSDLDSLRAALPPLSHWMVCAFGPMEHACLRYAARLGGDLRVGFENAIHQENGTLWPNVEASVASLRTSLQTQVA